MLLRLKVFFLIFSSAPKGCLRPESMPLKIETLLKNSGIPLFFSPSPTLVTVLKNYPLFPSAPERFKFFLFYKTFLRIKYYYRNNFDCTAQYIELLNYNEYLLELPCI